MVAHPSITQNVSMLQETVYYSGLTADAYFYPTCGVQHRGDVNEAIDRVAEDACTGASARSSITRPYSCAPAYRRTTDLCGVAGFIVAQESQSMLNAMGRPRGRRASQRQSSSRACWHNSRRRRKWRVKMGERRVGPGHGTSAPRIRRDLAQYCERFSPRALTLDAPSGPLRGGAGV